jgi:peptidoglycan hydrolase CwlO-like protein
MKFKLLKSNKTDIDYESLYHELQKKLSWYIEALETKQIQCDTIESVASNLRQENSKLKKELEALKQGMLDLPKLLGKNLGK